MGSGEWAVVNGQWLMVNGQSLVSCFDFSTFLKK